MSANVSFRTESGQDSSTAMKYVLNRTLNKISNATYDSLVELGANIKKDVKANIKSYDLVNSGDLYKSIYRKTNKAALKVEVGSTSKYASYPEYGTGIYNTISVGRPNGWVYMDRYGDFWFTYGQRPTYYFYQAVYKNSKRLRKVAIEYITNIQY